MANIVDEFLIQLGLDSSKFDKAQEKTIQRLRKMEDIQRKDSKKNLQRIRETTEGYNKLRAAVVGFGTALLGVSGMKDFLTTTVSGNAALGRQSRLLGMSAKSLDAWGWAAERFGGSHGGVVQSLQNMEGAYTKFHMGQGGADFLKWMGLMHLRSMSDLKNFGLISERLMAIKKQFGMQGAYTAAGYLGIDRGTFQMLMQGPQKVDEMFEKAYRLDGVTKQNVQDSTKLLAKWVGLKERISAAGQRIFHDMVPALNEALTVTDKIVNDFDKLDKQTHGVAGKAVAGGLIATTLGAPLLMLKKLFGFGGKKAVAAEAEGAAGSSPGFFSRLLSNPWTAGVALMLHSRSLDVGEDAKMNRLAARWKAAHPAAGAPSGLPEGLRNNNPGNIRYGKFAQAHGATGRDSSGFAIFPSMSAGKAAMAALLQSYRGMGIDTIAGIVSRYAPSNENNTGAYISSVSKQTGIGANAQLTGAQMASVQRAMMIQENGARYAAMLAPRAAMLAAAGRTTVETHIGTINVNAPAATDANGIARGMKQALQQNTMIAGGLVGVT